MAHRISIAWRLPVLSLFLGATFLLSSTAFAAEEGSVTGSVQDPALDPMVELPGLDLEDLEPVMPIWDQSVVVRLGAGYKDNVLFSHSRAQESPLFMSALELFALAPSLRGTQISFFATFEDTRFFSAESIDKEQIAMVVGQAKRPLAEDWEAGLSLQYLYQDQVLDVLILDVPVPADDSSILHVVGHRLTARPSLRWKFARPYWLEVEGGINRQLVKEPLSDNWESGPKMTLGRGFGKLAEVTLSYEYLYNPFDERMQATREGLSIPNSSLVMHRHRVELGWRQFWDTNRHWRTTTRLFVENNVDNGAGYYNVRRYSIAEQLRYAARQWEVRAQARVDYYEYPHQTTGATDPAQRRRTSLRLNLRGERKLGKHATLFAEAEHEQSISRLNFDDYQVNTIFSGIDWEF